MDTRHWADRAGIAALIIGVAGFRLNVGMIAIIIATLLILARMVEEQKAIKGVPWGVILMVTGVTVLIALLEKTEGLALFTSGIARLSTPSTIAPVVAFGTGVVSVYSSTGGVVLPAFLPMAPDLAQSIGGSSRCPSRGQCASGRAWSICRRYRRSALSSSPARPPAATRDGCSTPSRLGDVDVPGRRPDLLGPLVRIRRPQLQMRVAILDDIHQAWDGTGGVRLLRGRPELRIFTAPFGDPAVLRGFDVLIANRERTRFTRELLGELKDVRLILQTCSHAQPHRLRRRP